MKLVDLNVLLYAVNRSSPHHDTVRSWWDDAHDGDEPIGLAWIVLSGFVRLSTRSGIFPRPLSVEEACTRVDRWLRAPATRVVGETEEHWRHLKLLLTELGTAGNLTTDAHLAALAIGHGATLVSCDTDFARFSGLRLLNPLQE